MKRITAMILISALIVSLFSGCGGPSKFKDTEDGFLTLTRGDITVKVDARTGMLRGISSSYDSIAMDQVLVDVGVREQFLFQQLGYTDFSSLATYELPKFWAKLKELPVYTRGPIEATEEGFTVAMTVGEETVHYHYTILPNGIALNVTISTVSQEPVYVNGVGFIVQGLEGYDLKEAAYAYPGSTPAGKIPFLSRPKYRALTADYAAPVVHITDGTKTSNILYVNEVEKWTTASYYDEKDKPCVTFLAATEGILTPEKPMEVGTLYLPLLKPEQDPYGAVSEFWASLGYHTPTDTTSTQDLQAVYSGHPYGTMDTNYFNQWTLREYADHIGGIADMGFDAIWLLPVFHHSGDNVYEPVDQMNIDLRYGGLEEATYYVEQAHAAGVKVLFDFVPHGPRPVYAFAKEHDDWCSKDKSGKNQIEWECVSMDYNHPGYSQYNRDLAKYYAETIGLDGGRIDCSMGGLPNWFSATGLRASAAGLSAGRNVVKDLRRGFIDGGAEVLLLPENFHPIPSYAEYTDVFYDMPLYRCIHDLGWKDLTDAEFVERLTDFLVAESKTSVSGQLKLRFLGNHDTVTWTFDAARAQQVHGTDRAKALWMVMGWIDGVLYIYQGDEDPAMYGLQGENLSGFFTELIAAKREHFPVTHRTEYIYTGSPIMAFRRVGADGSDPKLVLVNLSGEPQSYAISGETPLENIGGYSVEGSTITLEPYAGVILK